MLAGPPTPLGCLMRILGLFGTLFLLAIIAAVVLAALAFAGSPGGCGKGIPAGIDQEAATAFQNKVILLNVAIAYGRDQEVTFDEREATARARRFLADNNAPVKDITLCFQQGAATGKAHIDTPIFGGVDVKVKGSADLSGPHPDVTVQEVRVGALPSFFTSPFKGIISRIADDQAERISLAYRYRLRFDQGTATLGGSLR